MKILRLSLLNLNSLRGKHEIDLVAEPLGSAGIFAITGHTGAGKSTLLDAITLALYGRAARYGESPNPEDMMSRHTAECRAEVEFEVPGRRPLKASWQLRRAKGQLDGKIQPAKRYIYDADGNVLAEKLREVDQLVEELCGLNYHRFTRSVLLAQGEFAKFLRAKPDERAELLESLTQTSIYSELGLLVHEEKQKREAALRESEALLTQVSLLDKKQRDEKTVVSKKITAELATLKTDRAKLAENVSLGKQLTDLLTTNKDLHQQQLALQKQLDETKPQFDQLKRYRQATPFLPQLTRWEQSAIEVKKRTQANQGAAESLVQAQANLHIALKAGVAIGQTELAGETKQLEQLKQTAETIQKQISDLSEWLTKHSKDAELAAMLPQLSSQITLVSRSRKQLAQLEKPSQWSDYQSAEARLTELTKDKQDGALDRLQQRKNDLIGYQAQVKSLSASLVNLTKANERLALANKAVKEFSTPFQQAVKKSEKIEELLKAHRDHRRTAERMASLEEHRHQLENGEPCPLCGALEHPFAESVSGIVKVSEIETKIKSTEAELSEARAEELKLRDAHSKAQAAVEEITKRQAQLNTENDSLSKQIETVSQQLKVSAEPDAVKQAMNDCDQAIATEKKIQQEIETAQQAIVYFKCGEEIAKSETDLGKLLKPLQIDIPKLGAEQDCYTLIEQRSQAFQSNENQLRQLKDQLRDSGEQTKEIEHEVKQTQTRLTPVEKRLAESQPLDGITGKSVNWSTLEQAIAEIAEIDQATKTAATQAATAEKELAEAKTVAENVDKALVTDLDGSPFENPQALLKARLPEEKRSELDALEKQLSEQEQTLKGRSQSTTESIDKLREQNVPEGEAFQNLAEKLKAVESTIETKTEAVSAIKVELENDDKNRKQYETKTASLAEEREQLKVWTQLHGLIGDSKGKKFRVYAQGISLDLLIRRANTHLQRLTERYLLSRVESEELELEIEDRFQANVTRPMASLSGGESFLASLALALGLSDLAGRNVQIDSLFIDEGFGSLDSDTLEVAISALESLRLSNKTVGVISHVEILKERITTQISVEKQPDGTSQVVLKQ